jgi:hypothetical protein
MSRIENQLNRLLQAAARAPKPAPGEPSFALETRVMRDWRAGPAPETGEVLVAWFRRMAIGACVLALASVAWNYQSLAGGGGDDELSIADSAISMGLNHD